MRCALYGKLPAKRDFIAIGTPRAFLDIWEPWMQGGISASRNNLKDEWKQVFLTAPIWRFWLGADLCGTTVLGAFMPSLDGVGRYFPLTLIAYPDEGAAIPPPELDPQDAWFAEAEKFLLATLEQDATFDAVTAGLGQLVLPSDDNPVPRRDDMVSLDGGMAAQAEDEELPDLFASLRLADPASVYAAATFWWTLGGDGYPPLALAARRMPAPVQFTEMLTGRFAFGFD
jgi:type VI secretion system protein ImpM